MAVYLGFGRKNPMTRLQWNDNTLPAAGGNCLRLWGTSSQWYTTRRQGPLYELHHGSVKGLEFLHS
jgi:hypothetical protein